MKEPLCNILDEIRNTDAIYAKCQLYGILLKREGIDYKCNGTTGERIIFLSPLYINNLTCFLRQS